MTNFEKYHEEMIEKKYKAVKNGKPISCKRVGCSECELYDEGPTCTYSLLKWLAKEYKEPERTLTKRQRLLCELLNDGWIARDLKGALWYYPVVPTKYEYTWNNYRTDKPVACIDTDVFPDFPFIRWEDEEPHSVKEMLKWEAE